MWGDASNKDLVKKRPNKDHLCPGDILFIPAEPQPALSFSVGTRNTFKAKVPLTHVKLVLQSTRPIGGKAFEVHGASGDDEPIAGTVGSDGTIEMDVQVLARQVEIRIPDAGVSVGFHIGDLDPIEEDSGAIQRLQNLGYLAQSNEEVPAATLAAGLTAFQNDNGLPPNGQLDDGTRGKLSEKHGS